MTLKHKTMICIIIVYVMYLMKDAKTLTVRYSIKEETQVSFQKHFFICKFQLLTMRKIILILTHVVLHM